MSDKNLFIKRKLTVKSPETLRLDVFVARELVNIPRMQIQKNIKTGNITVNEENRKPSSKVIQGDKIDLRIEIQPELFEIEPQKDLSIEIVSEHKDFLVIAKPCGISVHPSVHEKENTVVNWVLAHFPEIKDIGENSLRPGIVHRLDKDTSGLLLVAKTQKSFLYFKKLFQERSIEKKYVALCWGQFKENDGEISTFIGRSKANPTKQATSANREKLINPKDALTKFHVLEKNEKSSLVEILLKTGRKHQIRIHFQSIGHPLVGDKKYSTKQFKQKNMQQKRLYLHAFSLTFEYLDKKIYSFKLPPLNFSLEDIRSISK